MQGITREYKGIQGITREYRGLQGITRGYKCVQGITREYMGLQGITWVYRLLLSILWDSWETIWPGDYMVAYHGLYAKNGRLIPRAKLREEKK